MIGSREFIQRLREKYVPEGEAARTHRIEGGDPLDRFLADASLPLAVFHSRALGRDFVLARDEAALDSLTEADRALPVLYFADCDRLAGLDARDLAVILDVRAAFGPSVVLTTVRPHPT